MTSTSLAAQALRALEAGAGAAPLSGGRAGGTTASAVQVAGLENAGWRVEGLVAGAAVFRIGLVRRPTGNREVENLSSAMYAARHRAITALRGRAAALGADGVIATTLDIHVMADHRHLPRFVAVGTAVSRDRPHHARDRAQPDRSEAAGEPFVTTADAVEFATLVTAGYQPLDLVMGTCVFHVGRQGLARWASTQTKNVEMTGYTMALYEARERAMERLQAEALQHHADGVVGVTVSESSHVWGSHVIEFSAIGTAVQHAAPAGVEAPKPQLVVPLDDPRVRTDPAAITHRGGQ